MRGLRLAFHIEREQWVYNDSRWGGHYKTIKTDKWDPDGDYMFCNCCGAQAYLASELKANGTEYGIGVCRGKLNVESNDKRQIDHVKTKNGWLTCWIELPREVNHESEEW